jgi:hypothetical protein
MSERQIFFYLAEYFPNHKLITMNRITQPKCGDEESVYCHILIVRIGIISPGSGFSIRDGWIENQRI